MQPTDTAVLVKRLDERASLPRYATEGSAGFDLATLDEVVVPAHSTVLAGTGLVIATPERHMLLLVGRSSTWKRWRVRIGNQVGIIDSDYCGDNDEILISLWNPGMLPRTIPAQTRIAQGVFVPIWTASFQETGQMGASRGGFGSSGA